MCIMDIPEEERENKAKNIWRNNNWKLPKFNDEQQLAHQRSSANSKEDKFKEILFLIHYYQMVKR